MSFHLVVNMPNFKTLILNPYKHTHTQSLPLFISLGFISTLMLSISSLCSIHIPKILNRTWMQNSSMHFIIKWNHVCYLILFLKYLFTSDNSCNFIKSTKQLTGWGSCMLRSSPPDDMCNLQYIHNSMCSLAIYQILQIWDCMVVGPTLGLCKLLESWISSPWGSSVTPVQWNIDSKQIIDVIQLCEKKSSEMKSITEKKGFSWLQVLSLYCNWASWREWFNQHSV